jgi:hypothetical protein
MKVRWIAMLSAIGLLTLPALADATSQLSATRVRIGDWATYVNVVVSFNGRVPASRVEFDKLVPTMANLHISRTGITTRTNGRTAKGVQVALEPGTQALHISASFAPHRFKYVSYSVDSARTGKHLVIGLWKSAPPPRGGNAYGYANCLSIRNWQVNTGSVSASGTERGVFEKTFQVVIRGANGKVLGRRTVVHGPSWSTKVKYKASHRQAGTLEAVAFSPKDGALACLYETRVTLPAS